MIVSDASVAVSLLLDLEPMAHRAWRRLEGERRVEAPELFDLELANTLRGFVRSRRLGAEPARIALLDLADVLPVRRHRHAPLLHRVWELRANLTAYDASYVALAEALDVPLLTADAAIAGAPGIRCQVELLG